MRNAFKAPRLVGLLALLAGLMAFGASAAQAEGTWLRNGVAITGNTAVNAKIDKEKILLTKVGLSKVEILCPEAKFVGANLQVGGLVSGKLHVAGCVTKLNGVSAAKCTPKSPGAASGLIETNAMHGSLGLHTGGVEVMKLLPTGEGVPIVTLNLGPECAIGNEIAITGNISYKDSTGQGLVDLKEHLFGEGPLSTLLFGANPMTIDGSVFVFLTSGETFAGHV